jgi:murein DD-endopeptidase MepM/ murein hydrolase activator NlpD
LTDYVGYGQPILAPADGQVVRAVDGFPDQTMQAPPASDAPGNLVVIRHATGEVSELLHLQPGSVAVRTGQSVVRGQRLGRCGNSGYSHRPHLHYNLTRGQGRDVTCLLASFAWIRVLGPQGESERRLWAPVRGEVIWSSTWSSILSQPSARPFQVEQRRGRLILQQP